MHAGIAQLARASAFQAEGREFESRFPLQNNNISAGWSSLVARRAHNPEVVGSNPTPASYIKIFDNLMKPLALLQKKIQDNFFFIVGPCVIENEELLFVCAKEIKRLQEKFKIPFIFKSSFDKANRSSLQSYRGVGIKKGLSLLQKIKEEFQLPLTTDIHESHQAAQVAEVVDILQIPAFLCRQTDLLVAAAKTQKILSIKKGQFLSAKDLKHVLNKILPFNNYKVLLLERGNSFGYQNLVVDFTNIIAMKEYQQLVVMDITHATQSPGSLVNTTGGTPEYSPYYGYAAAACGVNGIFLEVHPNPLEALSDSSNMLPLAQLEKIVKNILAFHHTYKQITS